MGLVWLWLAGTRMEKLIRNFKIPLTLPLQKGENLDIFRFNRKDIIINQMQTVPKYELFMRDGLFLCFCYFPSFTLNSGFRRADRHVEIVCVTGIRNHFHNQQSSRIVRYRGSNRIIVSVLFSIFSAFFVTNLFILIPA